jgi:hypothetical protein
MTHRARADLGAPVPGQPERSTRQPLDEEGVQEFRLLVGQRVSGVVDHGERGVRVVVDEVGGGGVSDRRVQPSRHDQGWARVGRRRNGRERPPFPDSVERRLVGERGGGSDVPFEHLRGLDHEVAPEAVVTDETRSGDDAVLWQVPQFGQQRADERQRPREPARSKPRARGGRRLHRGVPARVDRFRAPRSGPPPGPLGSPSPSANRARGIATTTRSTRHVSGGHLG